MTRTSIRSRKQQKGLQVEGIPTMFNGLGTRGTSSRPNSRRDKDEDGRPFPSESLDREPHPFPHPVNRQINTAEHIP